MILLTGLIVAFPRTVHSRAAVSTLTLMQPGMLMALGHTLLLTGISAKGLTHATA